MPFLETNVRHKANRMYVVITLGRKIALWDFKTSTTDERLVFLSLGSNFKFLMIFVGDLACDAPQ